MIRRPAVSRVEVLVGVLIAVLVVGLFLALIGRLRGDANQMKCGNNLRQLGLAVHNCHDTVGTLPPLTDQGTGSPTGKGLPSVFAHLMPYIEAALWYYRPGRTKPDEYCAASTVEFAITDKFGEPRTVHGGVVNHIWRVFLCPSDSSADQLRDVPMTLPDGSTGYYATGSYAANGLVAWGTGPLGKAFPRGTENTVLMAERPQVCRTAAGNEVFNLWGVGFYSPHMPAFACLTPADPPGLASTGQLAPVEPLPEEGESIPVRIGRRDASPQPPDFETPLQRVRDGRCDPRMPGGPHSSGMVVLMADGSTRMFRWDTSAREFWTHCVPGKPVEGP